MQIHELQNSTSVFASDDFVMVSGPTNNTRKMSKDALLEQTATNTLKNNLAPEFDSTVAYTKGQFVTYQGKIYQFTSDHSAGAWNASHATVSGQNALLKMTAQNALAGNLAPLFDPSKPNDAGGYAYYAGTNVTYEGQNFVFIANHKAGAWNPLKVEHKPLSESINLQGVGEAVANWLDEHPEATTTVEDGSLTEQKFTDELKLLTIKDYVTPEMFGAKGDGVTDDTDAFTAAFAVGDVPVIGDLKRRYAIRGLLVRNKVVKNCKFAPVSGYSGYGITIKGRCLLSNCDMTGFSHNLVFDGAFYSKVEFCSLEYAKVCNIYIDCEDTDKESNSNSIAYCHILHAGSNSQDDSSPEYGCGIYVNGAVLGLFIHDNCFEVNKYYGIRYRMTLSTRLSGMIVYGNYFEAHTKRDITLAMFSSAGRSSRTLINGNTFSSVSGYWPGVEFNGPFFSCYGIYDMNGQKKFNLILNNHYVKPFASFRVLFNAASFNDGRKFEVEPVTHTEALPSYLILVCHNELESAVNITDSKGNTIAMQTGVHSITIFRGTCVISRVLVNAEYISFVDITPIQ